MNYELANQLKDAGFPDSQHWIDCGDFFTDEEGHQIPSLEELIEALGNVFYSLMLLGNGSYRASSMIESSIIVQTASTPSEAVARLWLALNSGEAHSER